MTVTVFKVGYDVDRFRALLIQGGDDEFDRWADLIRFRGFPRRNEWVSPPVYSDPPELPMPDVWHLVGSDGIGFSGGAVQYLGEILTNAGELLQLLIDGAVLQLLNVTRVVACIDEPQTSWRPDGSPRLLAFDATKLPTASLFRIPQRLDDVYCRTGLGRTDFLDRLQRHELRGLRLTKVWDNQAGAIPLPVLIGLPDGGPSPTTAP